ncbi:MAG: crosslink repair DNA glycosylase YcaQ family protein [Micropruina sp.]
MLDRITADVARGGPLTARQIENEEQRQRTHWGWNWSEAKYVLEYLFDSGAVAVASRNQAFERRYDLSRRVPPPAGAGAARPVRRAVLRDPGGPRGLRARRGRPEGARRLLLPAGPSRSGPPSSGCVPAANSNRSRSGACRSRSGWPRAAGCRAGSPGRRCWRRSTPWCITGHGSGTCSACTTG